LEGLKKERGKGGGTGMGKWEVRFETGRRGFDPEHDDGLTEETEFGRIALPDHKKGRGWGPIYYCVITKVSISPPRTTVEEKASEEAKRTIYESVDPVL